MAKNFTPGANTYAPGSVPLAMTQPLATQVISGDGAITLFSGMVLLTKGSAAAITIAVPDQDGQVIWVITTTAQAHVITQGTVGFNGKGSSGTATWTAAIGNAVCLISYNGNWYAAMKSGVTIA